MKTIVDPREHINKLWGKQRINTENTYRMMKYVLRVNHDGEMLLHNVVTGQLVVLEPEEAKVVDKLPLQYDSVMEQLVSEHYLVPDDFNEYKSVNQLRLVYQKKSNGSAINHFVILPTTFCNAHCFYCYESEYPRVHMTAETANKIIDYIDHHRKGKDVSIQWFGGEPLVGVERIDQISQGLKDRGVPFTASMISNGYIFDEAIIKRSAELWNLKRIQITLDGTEDTYNRVKAFKNVSDSPFQRVLKNIDVLSNYNILVNIRLNVDFYNKDDIGILIEELGERYSGNKYVTVYLNMLFNNEGYEPVSHTYDEMITILGIIAKYSERLKCLQVAYDNMKPISLQISQCMADNPHALMIQPDGSFCRCEHETIHDSYGDLDNGIVDQGRLNKWVETIEPSDYCPQCELYPVCYKLRNCMNSNIPCINEFRLKNLEKQAERIRTIYAYRKEHLKQ